MVARMDYKLELPNLAEHRAKQRNKNREPYAETTLLAVGMGGRMYWVDADTGMTVAR